MRGLFLSLALCVGCMPDPGGTRTSVPIGDGIPSGLVVDFGYGTALNGSPACGRLWNTPPACLDGGGPVAWLAYQDASGEGCMTTPEAVLEHTVDDPPLPASSQRWSFADTCEPVRAECLCEAGARCALPDPDPAQHTVIRFVSDAVPSITFGRRYDGMDLVVVGRGCAQFADIDRTPFVPLVEYYDLAGERLGARCYNQEGERCCEGDRACLDAVRAHD